MQKALQLIFSSMVPVQIGSPLMPAMFIMASIL